MDYVIRNATRNDMPQVLHLIKELATFEKEPHAVEVTADDLKTMALENTLHFIVL